MFWLSNKKSNFQIRTLTWRPECDFKVHSVWGSISLHSSPFRQQSTGSKQFDTQMLFQKEFFEKVNFEESQQKRENYQT